MSVLSIVMRTARRILGLHPEGGKVAKNVLTAIAIHADETGYSWPSQAALAAATGFTVRAVRKALADLEAEGLITRKARFRRDGTRDSDGIQLCLARIYGQDTEDNRNPIPVAEPATTGIARPNHRNPTAAPAESDSGLVTLERFREESTEHSDPNGSAPLPGASRNFRSDLFDRGLRIVVALTGRAEVKCRALIGSWLALCRDDAATVMRVLDDAEGAELADAVSWIEARLKRGPRPAARPCGQPPATPVTNAAAAERQAQAQAMVARGQWPRGGTVFVAADSPAADAWTAYFAPFGVRPMWIDQGRAGRGWLMPSELPPMPPPAAIAA